MGFESKGFNAAPKANSEEATEKVPVPVSTVEAVAEKLQQKLQEKEAGSDLKINTAGIRDALDSLEDVQPLGPGE